MTRSVVNTGTSPVEAVMSDVAPTSDSINTPSPAVSEASIGGDPNISRPIEIVAAGSTSNMNGHAPVRVPPVDYSILPGGVRSLSTIAFYAFALGTTLGACLFAGLYLAYHENSIWRLPIFLASLSVFHFLEFYTTSRWATVNAKVSSYLLFSNGAAYNIAHASAMAEIIISSVFFPQWQTKLCNKYTIAAGLFLVILGQAVRSTAMAQAGRSFNHIPQRRKREDHVLVTSGIYAWSRHPSYFGYYWFAVGTQIMVGNKICAIIYAIVLWVFFKRRIPGKCKSLSSVSY